MVTGERVRNLGFKSPVEIDMRREAAGLHQAPRFKSTLGLFMLWSDLSPSSVNCKMFDNGIPKTRPPLLFDRWGNLHSLL